MKDIMQDRNPGEPVNDQLQRLNLEIASAQLQKLQIEITNAKRNNTFNERLTRYVPIITVLVAAAGFLWGVVLFVNQQERDRATKEFDQLIRSQTQFNADIDQLLQFPSNDNITVSKALFLYQNLNDLIDLLHPSERQPKINQERKDDLDRKLIELIYQDCDFSKTRHVILDTAAMQNWKGYVEQLKGTPNKQDFINKYIRALKELHSKNPLYIDSIMYDPKDGYGEYEKSGESLFIHFKSVVEGFSLHLKLLPPDQRTSAVKQFNEAINNPILTADLFESVDNPQVK